MYYTLLKKKEEKEEEEEENYQAYMEKLKAVSNHVNDETKGFYANCIKFFS